MTGSSFNSEPEITESERHFKGNKADARWADRQSDGQRAGMAAPRPIKGILKNKNSGANLKSLVNDVPVENPEQAPVLPEDDQQ